MANYHDYATHELLLSTGIGCGFGETAIGEKRICLRFDLNRIEGATEELDMDWLSLSPEAARELALLLDTFRHHWDTPEVAAKADAQTDAQRLLYSAMTADERVAKACEYVASDFPDVVSVIEWERLGESSPWVELRIWVHSRDVRTREKLEPIKRALLSFWTNSEFDPGYYPTVTWLYESVRADYEAVRVLRAGRKRT